MAEIVKTPTLGLNKPPKGYFDWDVPLNENWDKLDFLGAGQLPLLTPMVFDHRLEGDEALGWAMQGSILDGTEYTSVWEKLKTAKDRAAQQSLEINKVTYTIFKDATTGWVFLDSANYNKAFTNLKDSLGFILTEVDGVKTITLPKREVYSKPSMSDANVFGAESLPNIKGTAQAHKLGVNQSVAVSGCLKLNTSSISTEIGDTDQTGRALQLALDASLSSSAYKDGAKVNPDYHTVFIYYKVGNTIVNQDQIDLGNIVTQLDNLNTSLAGKADTDLSNVSSNLDYVVESGSNYIKFKSKILICWGSVGGNPTNFPKPFGNTSYSISITLTNQNSSYAYSCSETYFTSKGTTSFSRSNTNNSGMYIAIGLGA